MENDERDKEKEGVNARVELFKLFRHWWDHLLRLIGIGGHLVTLWVCVSKHTYQVIEASVGPPMARLQLQQVQVVDGRKCKI